MRAQRGVEVVQQADAVHIVQTGAAVQQADFCQQLLGALVALLGEKNLAAFFVHRVVAGAVLGLLPGEARDNVVDAVVKVGALLGRARNNQRRPRLVN